MFPLIIQQIQMINILQGPHVILSATKYQHLIKWVSLCFINTGQKWGKPKSWRGEF